MEIKTIFEWAEMFQEQIQNGASQSDIIQMLEEYGNQALRIHDVSGRSKQLKGEYTEHFVEWRDKYFDYNPILVEWKTKKRNERYTTKQILSRYEKAMCKSPFNCH